MIKHHKLKTQAVVSVVNDKRLAVINLSSGDQNRLMSQIKGRARVKLTRAYVPVTLGGPIDKIACKIIDLYERKGRAFAQREADFD